jgi:hypothetical protein
MLTEHSSAAWQRRIRHISRAASVAASPASEGGSILPEPSSAPRVAVRERSHHLGVFVVLSCCRDQNLNLGPLALFHGIQHSLASRRVMNASSTIRELGLGLFSLAQFPESILTSIATPITMDASMNAHHLRGKRAGGHLGPSSFFIPCFVELEDCVRMFFLSVLCRAVETGPGCPAWPPKQSFEQVHEELGDCVELCLHLGASLRISAMRESAMSSHMPSLISLSSL